MFHKPVQSFPDCGSYRKFGWKDKISGKYHTGDDYPCAVGDYVCAVLDGEVVLSQDLPGFGGLSPSTKGGCIIVKHYSDSDVLSSNKFFAVYGHLSRWVSIGATVKKGQVIGTIREFSNDSVSCPHLHFGVYTGSVMPITQLGYNASLLGYNDPDVWLSGNATGVAACVDPNRAEWNPILYCS